MKKILCVALCLLIFCLGTALAEANFAAGDLTPMLITESYKNGNQLDLSLSFAATADEALGSRRAQALASLIEKVTASLSFSEENGAAAVHGEMALDGITVLQGDMLLYPNGSVQVMTNLTGNAVLSLPEGSFGQKISMEDLLYSSLMTQKTMADLSGLTPFERLQVTGADVIVLIMNHVLGWVSFEQIDNDGEFYTFDNTYIEETETRDAVAQRMIGTVYADAFTSLFWNIVATIDAEKGDFQQALADCLAEMGVTRLQFRHVVDALFTEEQIDPAVDMVQLTHAIPDDGALCEYNDVSYLFKKLYKCTDKLWEECMDDTLTLIVSYDENGRTVGFDAVLPKFTESLPYEGVYNDSLKTDEDWQTHRTMHGELELYDEQRIFGDLALVKGEDVDGKNTSSLNGQLELVNRKTDGRMGVGVSGEWTAAVADADVEALSGTGEIALHMDGESVTLFTANAEGQTKALAKGFETALTVHFSAEDLFELSINTQLEQASEKRASSFVGGRLIDLTKVTEDDKAALEENIVNAAKGLAPRFVLHPSVLADVLSLIGE